MKSEEPDMYDVVSALDYHVGSNNEDTAEIKQAWNLIISLTEKHELTD